MKILSFDVSITGCAVGVLDISNGRWVSLIKDTDRGQAEILIPMIEEVVHSAACGMSDIDAIAVTCGPGSFTGVRIGIATSRSLGLALDVPVYGASTLDIIRATTTSDVLVLIDTKRDDYYGVVGDDKARIWSKDDVLAFDGAVLKDAHPDIQILAQWAAKHCVGLTSYDTSRAPQPIYIRDAEVSQSKKISPFAGLHQA